MAMIWLDNALPGAQCRAVIAHLRLPIQATLAPLFLCGVLAAARPWTVATSAAFLALHVFLYGGATLFNAYYDRDVGPIAGLERPATLPAWSLPFSLLWQSIGVIIAAVVSLPLGTLGALYALVSALYSHPWSRLKGRPILSATLIFTMQGIGGCVAGWLATRPQSILPSSPSFWLLALAAASLALAFYPLTQIYQIEEDAARGDRTLAMLLRPRGTFAFATIAASASGMLGVAAFSVMDRLADGLVLAGGVAAIVAGIGAIGQSFDGAPLLLSFRRLVRLQLIGTTALTAFLLALIVAPGRWLG